MSVSIEFISKKLVTARTSKIDNSTYYTLKVPVGENKYVTLSLNADMVSPMTYLGRPSNRFYSVNLGDENTMRRVNDYDYVNREVNYRYYSNAQIAEFFREGRERYLNSQAENSVQESAPEHSSEPDEIREESDRSYREPDESHEESDESHEEPDETYEESDEFDEDSDEYDEDSDDCYDDSDDCYYEPHDYCNEPDTCYSSYDYDPDNYYLCNTDAEDEFFMRTGHLFSDFPC